MPSMTSTVLVAGVDEAGRGPLAGPVVAAAVILPSAYALEGLSDSKRVSVRDRRRLESQIQACALAWAVGRAEADEIDRINILRASLLAMQRAVEALEIQPTEILVDGQYCPAVAMPAQAIVKGDGSVPAISAASILAKEARDREMVAYAKLYPNYGFDQHKGYPTRTHLAALAEHGVCPIHRRSYAPVQRHLKLE